MPGLDGLQAAREITSRHQVAVMLLTAFSQRDLIEEARDAGVSAYLVKPFQARELLPAVAGRPLACPAGVGDRGRGIQGARRRRRRTRSPPVVSSTRRRRRSWTVSDLSENDAFTFIQQTAMQNRARMRDVAQQIVDGTLTP